MRFFIHNFLVLLLLSWVNVVSAQEINISRSLEWKGIVTEYPDNQTVLQYLYFNGAATDYSTSLPLFQNQIAVNSEYDVITAHFTDTEYLPCSVSETAYLEEMGYGETTIGIKSDILVERKNPIGMVSFIPLRKNPETGFFEKLVSFDLSITLEPNETVELKSMTDKFAEESVLNTGTWHKIKVEKTGIYKISYSDLVSYGIGPSSTNPKDIRIYGNGEGMLPERNADFRYDDLKENAIYVYGEDDGIFSEDDYILFFGRSPHVWNQVLDFIDRQIDYYDDYNYYFITTSLGPGKRIAHKPGSALTPTHIVNTYTYYDVYEEENLNLLLSGKTWYADEFGVSLEKNYQFHIPEIVTGDDVIIKFEFANRTFSNDEMIIRINDNHNDTVVLTAVNPASTIYARKKKNTIYYNADSPDINIGLQYLPYDVSSRAWLDNIRINATRNLKLSDGELLFRDLSSVGPGNSGQFEIQNSDANTVVWEVTHHLDPVMIDGELTGNLYKFTCTTDSLREFIAFNGTSFPSPEFVENVENQNLHGSGPVDMVIVTYPLFLDQANRLDTLHKMNDSLVSLVVTPEKIYNEFSCGSQDPTAIRDFLRMLYSRYEGNEPRFLLLFGDGSFDPKDRLHFNTNLIPTFQTEESLISASSYVVEDYFGLLDNSEGNDGIGILDVGIGRLPVINTEEADLAISRIIRYINPAEPQFGDWRNKICIIADDEDNNLHLKQADTLANGLNFIPKVYNVNKIYLDSYYQVRTPKGDRYPEVTEAINKQMEEGALIMNYVGHGGKSGWAHERILQSTDISNWTNFDKLPVFITATCEFSRFDEPEIQTGGELTLLNPNGGGIALFTTTRLAYSNSNFALNQLFYLHAFERTEGEMPYLGDLIRLSKPPGQYTTRNFVLLGDPALKIAYPKFKIETTHINGIETSAHGDTLKSLKKITVKGIITDQQGRRINDFNGTIHPSVYDKPTMYKTIGNDANSIPTTYYCQDKVVWKGKASVVNGDFEFEFIVPKDISLNYGNGKLSFYGISGENDAAGYFNDFVIGGIDENAATDNQGPDIDLYINDLTFESGDQTHENPLLIAFLNDTSGINVSNSGIGHDIIAIMNDDYANEINLTGYYKPGLDNFRIGTVEYPFYNLPDGNYTIQVKAWDAYNNSSENSIDFIINKHAGLELSRAMNYPNPFDPGIETTTFSFKHTRPGDELEINLQIFDITGRMVLRYENSIISEGTDTPFLRWDGTDSSGNVLGNGIYLYTLTITDEDNNVSQIKQKLIVTD
ncbi:MAG: type IX secretion system sortase PorU [Bacteroidales bacterium]|nr:type IX secretion system sortase PorU [Bacteroidales bacterium]